VQTVGAGLLGFVRVEAFELTVGGVTASREGSFVEVLEEASQVGNLDTRSLEEETCVVEEDGIRLVHRNEAADIDNFRIVGHNLVEVVVDIDALEGIPEIVVFLEEVQ